jgi:hypothetical protein
VSVAANEAAYEVVQILESSFIDELAEGKMFMESVRELLSVVGMGELLSQLREARDVTASLREMGCALSPATMCILGAANDRAEMALRRARALGPQA